MRNPARTIVLFAFLGLAVAQTDWTQTARDVPPSPGGVVQPPPTSATPLNAKETPWAAEVWNSLGSSFKAACDAIMGKPIVVNLSGLSVPVPVVLRPQPELEWVCGVAEVWKTVNGILAQDWVSFGASVVGTWIGDVATGFLTALGIEAGSASWSSQLYALNEKLKTGYRDFVKSLYNMVWESMKASLDKARRERAAGATPTTAGNKVQQWLDKANQEAKNSLPEGFRQVVTRTEEANEARKAAVVAMAEREANRLINEQNPEEGEIMEPTNLIAGKLSYYNGNGTQPGLLSDLTEEAKQAPDTRTAVEVLTKAVTEVVRAGLYGDDAVVRALRMVVEQQVMTNRLLAASLMEAGSEAYALERAYEDAIMGVNAETFAYEQVAKAGAGIATSLLEGIVPDFNAIGSF